MMIRKRLLPILILAIGACSVSRSQEFSFLTGLMNSGSLENSSYSWQIDYRQDFTRNFAGSLAWINEGHVPGHHRDGTAWEGWTSLPFFRDRLSLSIGAGVYYYFDTQPTANGGSVNLHGTAPIGSLAATAYLSDRVFFRLLYNRINPSHDNKVNTLVAGVGYWFGHSNRPLENRGVIPDDAANYITGNEIILFGGQSVVNTLVSEGALATSVEFRRGLVPHVDWTASYIYEGDPHIIRRGGFAAQLWPVNTFLHNRLSIGLGFGAYVYIDKKHSRRPEAKTSAAIAPLVSPSFSYAFYGDWLCRVTWNRVVSNYNRDADVFLVGFGYRWPRPSVALASR